MSNTNDKPGQAPVATDANAPKQPSTGVTPTFKPATDEEEENKTKDPTTVGNGTKQPTDPNNPQAKSGDAPVPQANQYKKA